MKLSARNQYTGTVSEVRSGPVSTEVTIAINDADTLKATLTSESAADLGLAAGKPCVALFKASAVVLGTGEPGRLSARNVFTGTVSAVKTGAVSSEVTLTTTGGLSIAATTTQEATSELGLVVGAPAFALVKASAVIVGV
ncbi:molybdopterin-binding protein [Plasticicumulans sp.]|uniref:TOBE domain-containing protein n=1 Tax=Plasticicumulans sp. TaxID=2307179 RepID=UPI002CDF296A|nr:TOBE domain-containing protein [Plasticicumulans sp.]MBS0599977.1 TOBE domain-containing protein [Pseudomonadota bacterium]HMV38923.1 TOBE domain-containing protein [Plasticicumulans sp.]HMW30790.1 TOBE domain-containing protein [Plasticicumulans sp.]HMW42237.1 TOBE domain-containing protein [Plasticicumulans sp.]HMX52968.1 TOBE domain-containing protein [Plasticicumulans sp.]